jgi:Acetyltransferases, including N-acetylases of ribosomal proteins
MNALETTRLLLRPISQSHVTDRYVDWLNDDVVYKYLETRGNYTQEMLFYFVEEQIKNNVFMWAIHLKENNIHIGNIKIDPINLRHGFGEYGILMGDKNEWGKGYAKEASERAIHYFFNENLFLRKINLGVVKDNVAAINLYQKLGFVIEGVYKNHVKYDNTYHDVIRMAIFNTRYDYVE